MAWTVEILDEDVQAGLAAMPVAIRAAFRRIVELIVVHGLARIHKPYAAKPKPPCEGPGRSGDP